MPLKLAVGEIHIYRKHHYRKHHEMRDPAILPDGREFYPSTAAKRNPDVGSLTLFATDARAWYDGLQVSANRRFAQGFSVLGSYTFSKALDEAPAAISFAEISGGPKIRMDSDDLARDKGLGAFDARHALAMSFLWKWVPHHPARLAGWVRRPAAVRVSGCVFLLTKGLTTPTVMVALNCKRLQLVRFARARQGFH